MSPTTLQYEYDSIKLNMEAFTGRLTFLQLLPLAISLFVSSHNHTEAHTLAMESNYC